MGVGFWRVTGDGSGLDGRIRDRWVGIAPWFFLMKADHASTIASLMPLRQGKRRRILAFLGPMLKTACTQVLSVSSAHPPLYHVV